MYFSCNSHLFSTVKPHWGVIPEIHVSLSIYLSSESEAESLYFVCLPLRKGNASKPGCDRTLTLMASFSSSISWIWGAVPAPGFSSTLPPACYDAMPPSRPTRACVLPAGRHLLPVSLALVAASMCVQIGSWVQTCLSPSSCTCLTSWNIWFQVSFWNCVSLLL